MAKKGNNKHSMLWPLLLIANVIVIYLAGQFYTKDIVMGNAVMPKSLAITINALVLTLALHLVINVINNFKIKLDIISQTVVAFITYVASVWLLARFAVYSGFGISSFLSALIIGSILTIIYLLVLELFKKKGK